MELLLLSLTHYTSLCLQQSALASSTLPTDTAGELDVLWHDSDTLSVDSTKVGILEEANEIGLGRLLEGKDGRTLEPQVGLEVLSNLAYKTLERLLSNQ